MRRLSHVPDSPRKPLEAAKPDEDAPARTLRHQSLSVRGSEEPSFSTQLTDMLNQEL